MTHPYRPIRRFNVTMSKVVIAEDEEDAKRQAALALGKPSFTSVVIEDIESLDPPHTAEDLRVSVERALEMARGDDPDDEAHLDWLAQYIYDNEDAFTDAMARHIWVRHTEQEDEHDDA